MIDPAGEIGLVTTGAGLSMQILDEIAARGHKPFNFCDIRTGQLRGDQRDSFARCSGSPRGHRSVRF